MFIDGRSIEPDRSLDADVCVIGAGPAGLTLAREMNAAGRRVVVVEAGGRNEEERGQLLQSTVDIVGLPYKLHTSRRCGVEGSAPMWFVEAPNGAQTLRLREYDQQDFGPRDWLGLGPWPLGAADLHRYYQRARQLFGVPPVPEGAWASWDEALSQSTLASSEGSLETKPFDLGLRDHFLGSVCRTVTRSEGVAVVHDAPVVELRCDESPGEVSSAVCLPSADKTFSVRARTFVLAGGAVENARLLLASRSRHPQGIGNEHQLVGRYFMEHPRCSAAIVIPRADSPLLDPSVYAIHEHRGQPVQRMYALRPAAAERARAGNHLFFFRSTAWSPGLLALLEGENLQGRRRGARLLRQAVQTRAVPERPGVMLREAARSVTYPLRWALLRNRLRTGRGVPDGVGDTPVLSLEVMIEQLPNHASHVQLADQRARLPRVQLDWRMPPDEWLGVARATRSVVRHLEAQGYARGLELLPSDGSAPPRLHKASHQMGTTRMDPDPRRGVVNRECRVHGMANLYVAGSSVFPTGGGANPMLTVLAMTLRLAEHLQNRERASPQTA